MREGTVVGTISPIQVDEQQGLNSTNVVRELQHDVVGCDTYVPEYLNDLCTRSCEELGVDCQAQVKKMLIDYQDVFSKGDDDIGRTNAVKHNIKTGNAALLRQPPRRAPMGQEEEITRQVDDLLNRGLIEPSNSPRASSVVLVTKTDGSKRFCIDYRKLNAVTIKDACPIPRIEESLDALSGSKWFCTLDLASGKWS